MEENCFTKLCWFLLHNNANQPCAVLCLVAQLCPTPYDPMDCSPPGPLFMGVLQAGILEWLLCPLLGELPNPGIKTRYLSLQVDSLLSESPGKPKSIGVGSLSILQGIFLTQESNQGLLHCRQILYQLSYQFSSVQLLSRVQFFVTPWTAACQASLSITNSRSLPKLMSTESVMPSSHLILCRPLLLLPSIFPSNREAPNQP